MLLRRSYLHCNSVRQETDMYIISNYGLQTCPVWYHSVARTWSTTRSSVGALTNLRSFLPGIFLSFPGILVRLRLIIPDRGDAHPRVTGCSSVHKAFLSLEDARGYMKKKGVTAPKEVIKDGAGSTTPVRDSQAFYAVAHGRNTGIYPYWQYERPR